jgi:hypothetical protein
LAVSRTDLDLSRMNGCAVMRIRAFQPHRVDVELMGPPGCNVPGVEALDFPMIWYCFFDVSVRRFEAKLASERLGDIDPDQSGITAQPGEEPSCDVRLKFAAGVLEFACRDLHRRIVSASEAGA